jgi:hypothetical protein
MKALRRPTHFVLSFAATAMIVACTADMAEQDSTNTLVTITELTEELFADVCVGDVFAGGCSVANDPGTVTMTARPKNMAPSLGATEYNDVVFDRYRVTYERADGRNVEGVDVPYAFDGVMNLYVALGEDGTASFTLVRHAAKLEPPLMNLRSLGGSVILTTLARVDFYGKDLAGRAISVTGYVTVTFGDFPD